MVNKNVVSMITYRVHGKLHPEVGMSYTPRGKPLGVYDTPTSGCNFPCTPVILETTYNVCDTCCIVMRDSNNFAYLYSQLIGSFSEDGQQQQNACFSLP